MFVLLLLPIVLALAPSDAGARCQAPLECLRAGASDPTFGNKGAVYVDVGNGSSRGAMDMLVLPDGGIVLGGSSTIDGGTNHDATLTRFTEDGALDPTFGNNGVVRVSLGAGNTIIQSLALQADGKILAAGGRDPDPTHATGQTTGHTPEESFLLRLESDGVVDTSFGVGGLLAANTSPLYRRYDRVLVQPDGRIVVVGLRSGPGSKRQFFAGRYDSAGAPDPGFGTAGVAVFNDDSTWATYERAGSVLADDGSILVATSAFEIDSLLSCALARIDANGDVDANFGVGGHVVLEKAFGEVCNLKATTQQADGKVLVSGTFYDRPTRQAFALMRLNDDGSLDQALRRRGRALTRVEKRYPTTVTAWAVALQPDGSIVQAGFERRRTILGYPSPC